MFRLLQETGRERGETPLSSPGRVPQRAGGLISEAVAPPAGRLGQRESRQAVRAV